MERIGTIEALEAHYGRAAGASISKVARRMTPAYRRWIMASRFCVLSTVGPEGTDATPRGDDGPVVMELDPGTLALPDWRGNNRLDALRNIVRDPRCSLLFLVPGSENCVRVNGQGFVTADTELRARFEKAGRQPATVTVVEIGEIYFQCARALMRARTWTSGDESAGLPSAGAILADMTFGAEGVADYDREWPRRAAETLW
ncbi:pyridoxamine 5'-phosphate oxidase family protein [Cribrihabitans sp. XS_ASV171]